MASQTAAKVRGNFSDVINQVAYGKERVVVERRGKPVVAVVSLEDLRLLEEMENRQDLEDAKHAMADVKKHGALPWGQVKKGKVRATSKKR